MSNIQEGPFIVTGASGQLGQQVVDNLLDAGVSPIIAISRSPEKLTHLATKGVEVRKGDFTDTASLVDAFSGGKRLLIISIDDLEPGKRLIAHTNAVAAAKKAGIAHIVYTSLSKPDENNPITFTADHRDTEALIEESGASYTILRNNLYTDMLFMSGGQSIAMGKHFTAAADGRTGYVTRADCARAAAAALIREVDSRVLDITGPATISQTDIAEIYSDISGKEISNITISTEDLSKALVGSGFDKFMADVFASFDTAIAKGFLDVATNDLQELTGDAGQSARDFLIENKAVFLAPPQN